MGRRESRRTSETPPGMWLSRAQKGLCYAWPLADKRKSWISGMQQTKANSLGEEQLGKLREEEEEPATEQERIHRFRVRFR